ncbi:YybH family protein [Noviherbaspirillum massiliense]|uniref:YybH family protein n=1 Tax=Noviherbaspirillum massiliense TaxID=1465823 RepID=UPI0002FE6D90|nr:nuclear transport factor 2 family protein [Noviherbaspirillum massiliense]
MSISSKIFNTAEETESAFYDAIRRADLDAVMALWADEEDIVCIHPGARRLIGHAAIRASWESMFEQGGIDIRPIQLHVTQNMLTSVHSIIEDVQRAVAPQSDIHILATNVYAKTAAGWRLVAHHSSVVPGEAPSDRAVAALLH